jgi:hypothetical protein
MPAPLLETFCLRLALGLGLALWLLPPSEIAPRFHRIQMVIVLGLVTAASLWAWGRAEAGFFLGVGLACGACLMGSFFWSVHWVAPARGSLIVLGVGLVTALADLRQDPMRLSCLGSALVDLGAALLLGLATTSMLVGHWYLIAPTMSLEPLLRLLRGLAGALAVRMVTAAGQIVAAYPAMSDLDAPAWLWLALRWGVGFVGLAGLSWMAWQTARIRSTQSATGILYVVTIFSFLGELTDQLLQEHVSRCGSA